MSGFRETRRFLAGTSARIRNPESALRDAGEDQIFRNTHRMRAGRDIDGRPFKASRRVERSGGQTLFDRGALAASQNVDASNTKLDYYSTDKRARAHWDGALIVPKKASFLTIPLRARGGMFGGEDLSVRQNRAGDRARHYKNTFFKWRGGRLFLFQKIGEKKVRALFMLVRSIKLPQRKWMGYGGDDLARLRERLRAHVFGERRR
jgi:hypothetical protein